MFTGHGTLKVSCSRVLIGTTSHVQEPEYTLNSVTQTIAYSLTNTNTKRGTCEPHVTTGGKAGKAAALPGFFKIKCDGSSASAAAAALMVIWLPCLPKIRGGPMLILLQLPWGKL